MQPGPSHDSHMTACSECPALSQFVDWIRATDDHAEYHLALIESTDRLLAEARPPRDESLKLADRLEKWRYHLLARWCGPGTADGESFLDALDLTAHRLAGQGEWAPRRARQALRHAGDDTPSMREAIDVLDDSVPQAQVIDRARQLTEQNFGGGRRRMLLYAPVYTSSHCINYCTYCGFRYPLKIDRRHLTQRQVLEQVGCLTISGFRHLLLVGGDFPGLTTIDYYRDILREMVQMELQVAVEIAAQSTRGYELLAAAGACGLTLYQETYDEQQYAACHPRGPKSQFAYRLEAPERAAEAGISRLGLGILLGLAEPRQELTAMLRHAAYLARRFPDGTLAFSLPRIREAPAGFQVAHAVPDELFVRLYCALRIAFPTAELVLSTRELPALRNRLAEICITQMSAGSSTTPGGYGHHETCGGEQFPVCDTRPPAEMAQWLHQAGFVIDWSLKADRACPARPRMVAAGE